MAIDITFLNNNSTANITANFQRVKAALEEALSRTGNAPNQMNADLDLNDNNIINVGEIISGGISASDYVTYAQEWANADEDTLVSVAAGGDNVDDYSAKHWAAKAEDESDEAAVQVGLASAQVALATTQATNAQASATAAALSALEMDSLIDAVEAGLLPKDYGLITNAVGEYNDYGSIT